MPGVYAPSDLGKVGVDIAVGTGAAMLPFTPLIGGVILYRGLRKGKKNGQSPVGKALGLKWM